MDAAGCQESQKPLRLRYTRDTILAIKEHAQVVEVNVNENLLRVNAAAQRAGRGKTKCIQVKSPSDRSRDNGGIVLGPQKRTWNTGCHVSYPTGRDAPDVGSSRGGKPSSEYRAKDRLLCRPPSEFKHDFRGTTRDRGGLRRNEVGSFCRTRARDDRHEDYRHGHYEEEPEWFSEGPTTVNETIELGRLLEEEDGDSTHELEKSAPKVSLSLECNVGINTQKVDTGSHELGGPRPAHAQSPDAVQPVHGSESQGSRFRHLFIKSDTFPDKKTNAVNDNLLELLRGSNTSSNPIPDHYNVVQVENKLRSLLLGHNNPRTCDQTHSKSTYKETASADDINGTKPKILTVEEIEAQLNITPGPEIPRVPTSEPKESESKHHVTTPIQTQFIPRNPISAGPVTCCSNLAPVLTSLAMQQQGSGTKHAHLQNPLGPFGILTNPAIRLPSANAVSASARINQLQKSDVPNSVELSGSIQQGTVVHPWDTQGFNATSASRNFLQPTTMNSVLNNSIGGSSGLNDYSCRSGNTLNPLTYSTGSMGPRRPIVKAQQTTALSQSITQTGIGSPSSVAAFGECIHDLDRRFFNIPGKSQFQPPGEALNSGDKPQAGSLFASPGSEFCLPNSHMNFVSPLTPLVASNNSNSTDPFYRSSKLRTGRPQSENTLAFLSQLVELDRSLGSPKTSTFDHLLASSVKAKTLEEIEH